MTCTTKTKWELTLTWRDPILKTLVLRLFRIKTDGLLWILKPIFRNIPNNFICFYHLLLVTFFRSSFCEIICIESVWQIYFSKIYMKEKHKRTDVKPNVFGTCLELHSYLEHLNIYLLISVATWICHYDVQYCIRICTLNYFGIVNKESIDK